ncbi:protein kinase domain-containing protein [Blastomyces dermatitidis ER-3]|uniref:Protein kinase domain-containing protein n=1 Tax=Ajellomyces dermatitidis (strain ER-3 / ATCC MYA-2586) TaxID=559297 RepID=A0ABX2VZS9_AJEDR|nr:protein kinase domain-containing protein [Blastomyces dermatitidis ER-3]OAT02647.1 protein kinase domain-containing protein [Blastomyces dermatitidis ER-3]
MRQPGHPFLLCHSTAESPSLEAERISYPESDVEDLEGYTPAVWLAHDQQLQCYVSLKILVTGASPASNEGEILRLLAKGTSNCFGRRFIPTLLDQFSFYGPMVGEPAGAAASPIRRRTPIMVLNYMHANDVCHEDLHLDKFLLRVPGFDNLSTCTTELYKRHGKPYEVPTRRLDGKPSTPHAPPHIIYPMNWNRPANEVMDPEIIISDYGTSFIASKAPSPTPHTPTLYSPPEEFFNERITTAADVWTLGVVLYDAMGERPLFETFAWDPNHIIAEMVKHLGTTARTMVGFLDESL